MTITMTTMIVAVPLTIAPGMAEVVADEIKIEAIISINFLYSYWIPTDPS